MLRSFLHSVERHHLHQNSKMKELGIFMMIRTFAISLFAIFIPIFFFERGESITNIFLYFFSAYLTEAIFEIITLKIFRKIGPKKTISLSVPVLLVYLYMLTSIDIFNWPIWLLGMVVGISLSLFWQPYQYLFSKLKDKEKASTEVSLRTNVISILCTFGPLFGGLLITKFGVINLIYVIIVLLSIAVFFFLRGEDIRVTEKFRFKEISLKKHKKEIVAFMGYNLEETSAAVVWPFFIFLMVGTYKAVGALTTITLILTVIITMVVGKLSDEGARGKFIKEGSVLAILINFGRAVSTSFFIYLLLIFFAV